MSQTSAYSTSALRQRKPSHAKSIYVVTASLDGARHNSTVNLHQLRRKASFEDLNQEPRLRRKQASRNLGNRRSQYSRSPDKKANRYSVSKSPLWQNSIDLEPAVESLQASPAAENPYSYSAVFKPNFADQYHPTPLNSPETSQHLKASSQPDLLPRLLTQFPPKQIRSLHSLRTKLSFSLPRTPTSPSSHPRKQHRALSPSRLLSHQNKIKLAETDASDSSAEAESPKTPTTRFHFRGASFDVINPHHSLALHVIETPEDTECLDGTPTTSLAASAASHDGDEEGHARGPVRRFNDLSSAFSSITKKHAPFNGEEEFKPEHLLSPPEPALVRPTTSNAALLSNEDEIKEPSNQQVMSRPNHKRSALNRLSDIFKRNSAMESAPTLVDVESGLSSNLCQPAIPPYSPHRFVGDDSSHTLVSSPGGSDMWRNAQMSQPFSPFASKSMVPAPLNVQPRIQNSSQISGKDSMSPVAEHQHAGCLYGFKETPAGTHKSRETGGSYNKQEQSTPSRSKRRQIIEDGIIENIVQQRIQARNPREEYIRLVREATGRALCGEPGDPPPRSLPSDPSMNSPEIQMRSLPSPGNMQTPEASDTNAPSYTNTTQIFQTPSSPEIETSRTAASDARQFYGGPSHNPGQYLPHMYPLSQLCHSPAQSLDSSTAPQMIHTSSLADGLTGEVKRSSTESEIQGSQYVYFPHIQGNSEERNAIGDRTSFEQRHYSLDLVSDDTPCASTAPLAAFAPVDVAPGSLRRAPMPPPPPRVPSAPSAHSNYSLSNGGEDDRDWITEVETTADAIPTSSQQPQASSLEDSSSRATLTTYGFRFAEHSHQNPLDLGPNADFRYGEGYPTENSLAAPSANLSTYRHPPPLPAQHQNPFVSSRPQIPFSERSDSSGSYAGSGSGSVVPEEETKNRTELLAESENQDLSSHDRPFTRTNLSIVPEAADESSNPRTPIGRGSRGSSSLSVARHEGKSNVSVGTYKNKQARLTAESIRSVLRENEPHHYPAFLPSSETNSYAKLTVLGRNGNITGTLNGTGMRVAGSSLAGSSSPFLYQSAENPSLATLSRDYSTVPNLPKFSKRRSQMFRDNFTRWGETDGIELQEMKNSSRENAPDNGKPVEPAKVLLKDHPSRASVSNQLELRQLYLDKQTPSMSKPKTGCPKHEGFPMLDLGSDVASRDSVNSRTPILGRRNVDNKYAPTTPSPLAAQKPARCVKKPYYSLFPPTPKIPQPTQAPNYFGIGVPQLHPRQRTPSSLTFGLYHRKQRISNVCMALMCIFPPLLVAYGHGLFDPMVSWATNGQIQHFGKHQKAVARVIGWIASVIIIVAPFVLLAVVKLVPNHLP